MVFNESEYNQLSTLLCKQIVMNQELDTKYKILLKKYTFLLCENEKLRSSK